MIPQIEDALAEFLTDKLAAPLAAITHLVRPGTSLEALPQDRIMVIAKCGDMPRVTVNGTIYDAMMEISVLTPLVSGITKAHHAAAVIAVSEVFVAANEADLSTKIAAKIPGYHGGGFFATGWQPGREDTAWLPVFAVKVGVVKDGI